jgi:prevent-host-death family protein
MASVGVRELKQRTSEVLRRVRERGEEIEVTFRGRVVARLVPAESGARTARRRSSAAWRSVDDVAREIARRWPKGTSAARAVVRDRRG